MTKRIGKSEGEEKALFFLAGYYFFDCLEKVEQEVWIDLLYYEFAEKSL